MSDEQTTVTEAMVQAGVAVLEDVTRGGVWPAYEQIVKMIYEAMESAKCRTN